MKKLLATALLSLLACADEFTITPKKCFSWSPLYGKVEEAGSELMSDMLFLEGLYKKKISTEHRIAGMKACFDKNWNLGGIRV
jgi:hypothetical protein